MSDQPRRHEMATKKVVYRLPGMESVHVRCDLEYATSDGGPLKMDLYYPTEMGVRRPAVLIVTGYPDVGVPLFLGCQLKDMDVTISLGQLIAASGMIAVAYTNRHPTDDLESAIRYIRKNAGELRIVENKIGIYASSGNVPNAMSMLMREGNSFVRCAVLNYGFMLDLDGTTSVDEASRMFKFVNPCVGKSVNDLPADLPILVTRAGQDQFPGLNESIDRFIAKAVARNLPISFI